MKLLPKIITITATGALLLGFAGVAVAAPNDFDYWHRDATDSTDVVNVMPTRATSTPALVGGAPGSDASTWYYVGDGLTSFSTSGNPGIGQSGNQQLGVDLGFLASNLDISSLVDSNGFKTAALGKESTSSEAQDVSNLQNQINMQETQLQYLASPSVANVTLAVNTARQASTTAPVLVTGSIDITTTLSLSGGTSGKVTLQISPSSSFSSGVVSVAEYTNSNTGTLTIGLNTSQIGTAVLSSIVPPGDYYRFATTNITGTPTYSTPIVTETGGI